MVRAAGAIVSLVALVIANQADGKTKQAAPPPINIHVAPPRIPAPAPTPSERYGDWTATYIGGDAYMATTTNNVGSVFGTACTKESCFAVLNPQIECTPGDKYPILVNAPGGTFSVEVLCEKLDDLLLYSFPIDTGLTEAMSVGGVIGIAFPMASGEFKVARFSLTGAARATARIQQIAQGQVPSSAPRNASDENTL